MHECKTAYFIQQAHLHKKVNRHCKNQATGHGDSDLIAFSVSSGIMTAMETFIVSTTEIKSMNGSITISHEIYISNITECNKWIKPKMKVCVYKNAINFRAEIKTPKANYRKITFGQAIQIPMSHNQFHWLSAGRNSTENV